MVWWCGGGGGGGGGGGVCVCVCVCVWGGGGGGGGGGGSEVVLLRKGQLIGYVRNVLCLRRGVPREDSELWVTTMGSVPFYHTHASWQLTSGISGDAGDTGNAGPAMPVVWWHWKVSFSLPIVLIGFLKFSVSEWPMFFLRVSDICGVLVLILLCWDAFSLLFDAGWRWQMHGYTGWPIVMTLGDVSWRMMPGDAGNIENAGFCQLY